MSVLAPALREPPVARTPAVRDAVLLTGATGFVGTELLARLLTQTERTIYVLVRADGDEHARERLRDTLAGALGASAPFASRVRALAGDITLPGLGLHRADAEHVARSVSEIIHGAASVSFDLDLERSRAINVQGTREMLAFARLCQRRGGLRRFTYVSTAYVAGLHRGTFTEDDLDLGQSFRNPYEQSKFEAERLVRSFGDRLAITVVRPSIIVGDSASGWTASFNVLYWPLRALARGAYPVLPARRDAPVDVVGVDYVAQAILALACTPEASGGTFHLTASEHATTIGELLEMSCAQLDCKAPPLISPWLYRRVLAPVIGGLRPARRRFLRATASYVPYFAIGTRYDDTRARALLGPQLTPAPLRDYFERIVAYALRTHWGARPQSRAAASATTAPPSRTGSLASPGPHGAPPASAARQRARRRCARSRG